MSMIVAISSFAMKRMMYYEWGERSSQNIKWSDNKLKRKLLRPVPFNDLVDLFWNYRHIEKIKTIFQAIFTAAFLVNLWDEPFLFICF